jgi:hypothetical protein
LTLASRFKLNQIVDVRLTVRNPVHAADNATQGKSSLGIAARHLLERLQHAILIEPTVLKVGFSAAPKFEFGRFVGQRSSQFLCQLIVAGGHGVDLD